MANTNIINAVFGSGLCAVTTSAFRANYGMKLRFSGIDLPTAFEVDFSNYDVMGHDSVTAIGQNGEVQIPDDLWDSGLNIYAYVYLHPTDDSGVTVYTVTIPVLGRPNRTDETPTPHEQTVIEQAISALNDAVEQTAADVASADASAQAAAQSEANASVSERSAAASASAALASQNAAESASQSATESASGASESAQNAANSASQAAESATAAQASAEQAERSVQSITDDVERAERAANTATGKATEAASSAATASTKATQAEQSATAAAQSASSASTAAQNAASSATAAESSATDAETAKQDAQDAKEAAEQAAQSVSGLSAQIAQNTADIADLVQNKAGVLIDTVSGSIASFVPDSTIPTVKGLSVDVEPVQDLHGYEHPWPAGGGKNLLDWGKITVGGTHYGMTFSKGQNEGTVTITGTLTVSGGAVAPIVYADNSLSGKGYVFLTEHISGNSVVDLSRTYGFRTENERAIAVFLNGTAGQSYTETIRISVYAPPAPTSWTPYKNICPISGWDAVEVNRTGKNLWDFDSSYSPTGYQVILNRVPFDLKAGTYTFSAVPNIEGDSIVLFGYHADGTRTEIARLLASTTRMSVASTISKDVVSLHFVSNMAGTISDIQLERGSTATAYTPYQGDTYTIQLGQTVYGGKIYAVQGKMVVDRYLYVYDGTEQFSKSGTALNGFYNNLSSGTPPHDWPLMVNYNYISRITDEISSMFAMTKNVNEYKQNYGYCYLDSGMNFDVPPETFGTTVESFKAKLAELYEAGTPVSVICKLATPITIDLTPLEISVLTGQNNIWADSGDVSVEYAADLKTYINNKIAAAVAALS